MTFTALEQMSESDDWEVRVQAAHLVARRDARTSEPIVSRLLLDPGSPAVRHAMAAALLAARREAAVPLILRALGEQGDAAQGLLDCLITSELDGVDVRGAITEVLLESDDAVTTAGALRAIGWLAPRGGFVAPPAAHARVARLRAASDGEIRALAIAACTSLAAIGPPPASS